MKYTDQKPTNADCDSSGFVLGWNVMQRRWITVAWPAIDGRNFTDWDKLPDAIPDPVFPKPTHPSVDRPVVEVKEPEPAPAVAV